MAHGGGDDTGRNRRERVLERVRATPPGFVRSYGDVSPGAPRFAGTVLASCDDPDLPWHRIVRADGSLVKGDVQRARLAAEGVPFRGARVDMSVARIEPSALDPASATAPASRSAPASRPAATSPAASTRARDRRA